LTIMQVKFISKKTQKNKQKSQSFGQRWQKNYPPKKTTSMSVTFSSLLSSHKYKHMHIPKSMASSHSPRIHLIFVIMYGCISMPSNNHHLFQA
jgi:hypothetical protein